MEQCSKRLALVVGKTERPTDQASMNCLYAGCTTGIVHRAARSLGLLYRAQDDSNDQEEGLNARAHLKDLSGGLWLAITGEDLAKDTQAG